MVSKLEEYCIVCGNKGLYDQVCPNCGRPMISLRPKIAVTDKERFAAKGSIDEIPATYYGVYWDKDTLISSKPEKQDSVLFGRYAESLKRLNDVYARGDLPQASAFIIAPPSFSKTIFAYSCMQLAKNSGWRVAPIIDTLELKRLLIYSAEDPKYKLNNRIKYDDYITSDVLFLSVTKTSYREYAYEVIRELVDKRSRLGLATMIISDYYLSEISKRDYTNSFDAIMAKGTFDDFRYPCKIEYKEVI